MPIAVAGIIVLVPVKVSARILPRRIMPVTTDLASLIVADSDEEIAGIGPYDAICSVRSA